MKLASEELLFLKVISFKSGVKLLILLFLLISVFGHRSASATEWQQKLNANYIAMKRLQQENVKLAQKIIDDPERDFIRVVSRKLKDHKGPESALTTEEQQKLVELRQRSIDEAAQVKAMLSQITDLTLDQFSIILSISEKCDFLGRFESAAEIIKKNPIVQKHGLSFWQLKWNYDKSLSDMGFDHTSCKTLAARLTKIDRPLSNQLKHLIREIKE